MSDDTERCTCCGDEVPPEDLVDYEHDIRPIEICATCSEEVAGPYEDHSEVQAVCLEDGCEFSIDWFSADDTEAKSSMFDKLTQHGCDDHHRTVKFRR